MKIDYNFLKLILVNLQENESHLTYNLTLAKGLSIDIKNDQQFDKFVGHIKLLDDNCCIDCAKPDLGFMESKKGCWVVLEINYRLTSQGYEFLDMLRENNIFNKIKNLSISTALEVGRCLLINTLTKPQ